MSPSSSFPKLNPLVQKILMILRAKTPVGGLEVSDTVLRFSNFDGKTWALKGAKLSPGVSQGGKIISVWFGEDS